MYRNGAEAKIKAESNRTFRLPIRSESDAAGKLIKIPGMVEAEATRPSRSGGVPSFVANGFRTGLFDMVELNMAKAPMIQRTTKYRSLRKPFEFFGN